MQNMVAVSLARRYLFPHRCYLIHLPALESDSGFLTVQTFAGNGESSSNWLLNTSCSFCLVAPSSVQPSLGRTFTECATGWERALFLVVSLIRFKRYKIEEHFSHHEFQQFSGPCIIYKSTSSPHIPVNYIIIKVFALVSV